MNLLLQWKNNFYKMRSFLLSSFIILSIIFLSGCTVKSVEMGDIEGIELMSVSKDGINFNVLIPISNENNYSLSIRKVDLDIQRKSGASIAHITGKKNIKLKPKSKETYRFNFDLKFTSIKNMSFEVISTFLKRSADLKIKGYVKVGKFLYSKKIEVDEQKTYQLFRSKDTKIQYP